MKVILLRGSSHKKMQYIYYLLRVSQFHFCGIKLLLVICWALFVSYDLCVIKRYKLIAIISDITKSVSIDRSAHNETQFASANPLPVCFRRFDLWLRIMTFVVSDIHSCLPYFSEWAETHLDCYSNAFELLCIFISYLLMCYKLHYIYK